MTRFVIGLSQESELPCDRNPTQINRVIKRELNLGDVAQPVKAAFFSISDTMPNC
jgi:hypothetical protein